MLSNGYVNFTATSLALGGRSFPLEILGLCVTNTTTLPLMESTLAPGLHRGASVLLNLLSGQMGITSLLSQLSVAEACSIP